MSGGETGAFRARGSTADTFTKVLLSVATALLGAGIVGGIKVYADLRVLARDVAELRDDKGVDDVQNASISRLWRAAAQNRDAINERHRDAPLVRWQLESREEP